MKISTWNHTFSLLTVNKWDFPNHLKPKHNIYNDNNTFEGSHTLESSGIADPELVQNFLKFWIIQGLQDQFRINDPEPKGLVSGLPRWSTRSHRKKTIRDAVKK